MKRVLSIIPARGGSKGLPGKNIIDLAGKPLIAWTIEASIKSKYVSKTFVSSDDDEILKISQKNGAEIIKRPMDLSTDSSSSESVVIHAIDFLRSLGENFDVIILLQPTSPLRTNLDIDDSLEILFNSNSSAVISVYKCNNKFLKSFTKNKMGYLNSVFEDGHSFMRRQDLPELLMPNGAIYALEIKSFLKEKSFFTNKTLPFLMTKINSLDIDNLDDLQMAEKIIKNDN